MDGQHASSLASPVVRGLRQAVMSNPTACGVRPVAINFQLVIDCTDPDRLCRFWAAALRYELEPPPAGFGTWNEYWRDVGVPEEELGAGADLIIDPGGAGPRIRFQAVPEPKTIKNRLHLDVCASGGRVVPIATRKQRVDAEARRLANLGATMIRVLEQEGLDHYAVAMADPEGNEFDIN
jgi:Glyoxalase-like domain